MMKMPIKPGLKLMMIGGLIMVTGLAGIMATPLVQGIEDNSLVVLILIAILVGGAVVCLIGMGKRMLHMIRTKGFLGVKLDN